MMMKTENTKKHLVALALMGLVGLGGCASSYAPPQLGDELVWTNDGDDDRPAWTVESSVASSGNTVEVVGMSNRHSTQRGARDAALTDARRSFTQYAGTEVDDRVTSMEKGSALQDGVQNPEQFRERVTTELASQRITNMGQNEWRYEQWQNAKDGSTFYKAFVLTVIDASQLEEIIDDAIEAAEE